MRRPATAVLIAALAVAIPIHGVAAVPDGFVGGREHEVRIRPILGELPELRGRMNARDRTLAQEVVGSCDPAAVAALDLVPTTPRSGDNPARCVVVGRTDRERPARLLLGPAYLEGSDLGRPEASSKGGRARMRIALAERGRSRWDFLAAQVGSTPLAFQLDGTVIGVAPIVTNDGGVSSITLIPPQGFDESVEPSVSERIDQARGEEVIELARTASMSDRARAIFADAQPRIDERTRFALDCPVDEAASSVVLGCYSGGDIFLLRVDRADLAGVMTVTAAHEMLHAAYAGLDSQERKRVDGLLDDYLTAPDPRVTEALGEYEQIPGSDLDDEAHSLVATLVRDLPAPLERYYDRYFEQRGLVVDAFETYRHVFDELQATYDRLAAEIDALSAELASVESQIGGASAEADRLFGEIESLRSQGRFEESNALVGAQNAAASRANNLVGRYNSLVASYNTKVDELNNAAFAVNAAYESLTPIEDPAG